MLWSLYSYSVDSKNENGDGIVLCHYIDSEILKWEIVFTVMKTNSLVQCTIIIIIITVYCIPEGAVTSQLSISFISPHYKPIYW